MIVDPDFFEHWRTTMLVTALGEDKMAPMYVLRLWAHCQNRKATTFNIPTMGLKALCRFAGDAELLEQALSDAGFISRAGEVVEIVGWAEQNAKLIANWKNGATGGRPPKTEEEPNDNPTETQPEPSGTHPEPIEEEKNGCEKNPSSSSAKGAPRGTRLPPTWQAPEEYLTFCKNHRPDLDASLMAEKFRDYWSAVPGQKGCKLDWLGTWRNFIRSERAPAQPRASPQAGRQPQPENFAQVNYGKSGKL